MDAMTAIKEEQPRTTPDPRPATAAGALKSYFEEWSKVDPTLRAGQKFEMEHKI